MRNVPIRSHAAVHTIGEPPAAFTQLADLWRGLMKELFDPYRPERHYMRGPGPKCHERRAVQQR